MHFGTEAFVSEVVDEKVNETVEQQKIADDYVQDGVAVMLPAVVVFF